MKSSESQKAAALKYYYKNKDSLRRKEARAIWWSANKDDQMKKQKEKKRARKLEAIQYLGGVCKKCSIEFHPAIYEFHHREPKEKDRDPSKMMLLSRSKLFAELDKCDLLCANCHRFTHHSWEEQ